jgi:hypothetical protein
MKSPKFYFDAQPTYDYWIVNQHAQDGRIQRVVFRTANKSRSDRAADALNRAAEKFARRRSDLPSDRIQAVPHDGRRGGEAVIDLVDDEVYAEGLPRVEAEELAGAIWNVAHDIARVNARAKTSRPNPTGAPRANPCGCSARANPRKSKRRTTRR